MVMALPNIQLTYSIGEKMWAFDIYSQKQFSILRVIKKEIILQMHLVECLEKSF